MFINYGYTPTHECEYFRLAIQSEISKSADAVALKTALSDLQKKKNLNVLDVGCAYGHVGQSRFKSKNYTNVVGIDKDADCIKHANEKFKNRKFSYYQVDLNLNFHSEIEKIKKEKNISKFDIVFIALVLQHLGDTVALKALSGIRNHMSNKGIIIVRSPDDGSKLAYNDDGLLEKIIKHTLKVEDESDRFNGRKIYSYLLNAGFNDIKIKSFMRDISTLNMNQRRLFFESSYSYRIQRFERQIKNNPMNEDFKKDYQEMKKLLDLFKNKFQENDFWYCEYDYIGIAKNSF